MAETSALTLLFILIHSDSYFVNVYICCDCKYINKQNRKSIARPYQTNNKIIIILVQIFTESKLKASFIWFLFNGN